MSIEELQNSIIKKVLKTSDSKLLNYLNSLLQESDSSSFYTMYDWEMKIIQDSISEHEKGDIIEKNVVFSKIEKWLNN